MWADTDLKRIKKKKSLLLFCIYPTSKYIMEYIKNSALFVCCYVTDVS